MKVEDFFTKFWPNHVICCPQCGSPEAGEVEVRSLDEVFACPNCDEYIVLGDCTVSVWSLVEEN